MSWHRVRAFLKFAANPALAVILVASFLSGCYKVAGLYLTHWKHLENDKISNAETIDSEGLTRRFENESSIHRPNEKDVALFFLIDESGGMSGKYTEDGVVVVDEEGERYQIVRFFLTLMGAYHRDIHRSYNLQIGAGQFADSYSPILPLTPAAALFDSQEWERANNLLSSRNVSAASSLDPRYTNFPLALDKAREEIERGGAKEKILVLITDGSFRSAQIFPVSAGQKHDRALRDATEAKLQEIARAGIKIYVLLIGASQCRKCGEECSLSAPKWETSICEERNAHLNTWNWWADQKDFPLVLLDEKRPVFALMEISELQHLLPLSSALPSYMVSGWADPSGHISITVHQYASAVKFWFFYTHSSPEAVPHLVNPDVQEVTPCQSYKKFGIDSIFFAVKEYPASPSPGTCSESQWVWEIGKNQQVFYIAQEILPPFEIDFQPPSEIVLNSTASPLRVTFPISITGGTRKDFDSLYDCYQIKVSLVGKDGEIAMDSAPISPLFKPELQLPLGLSPQKMTIQAQLFLSMSTLLNSKSAEVLAKYTPELLEVRVDKSNTSNSPTNVSVLIRYGNQTYVPDFQPRFYLSCEPVQGATPAAKCFNPAAGLAQPHSHGPGVQPEVEVYTLTIPYKEYWEPGCGCRVLRIMWNASGIQSNATCDLRYDPAHCSAMLPVTPSPTPSAGGSPVICHSAFLPVVLSFILSLLRCSSRDPNS